MSETSSRDETLARLPARDIPLPAALSAPARAALAAGYAASRPSGGTRGANEPDIADRGAWLQLIAAREADAERIADGFVARLRADIETTEMGARPVYVATPRGERLLDDTTIIADIHGGALVFGGGPALRLTAAAAALRTGRKAYSLDYRMPPSHPYPAALDDALAFYDALRAKHPTKKVVFLGTSAGGNIAAAALLRAREEGLPLPAGLILLTPEVDLTESGDSFNTLMGLDIVLGARLMPMNLLYAGGADLSHPYVSPLFGDFAKGFPPTMLQTGTRDLFLSNTVRMHRALRRAGVRAELHVWDGMPHAGFGGMAPEDREVSAEMQAFISSL